MQASAWSKGGSTSELRVSGLMNHGVPSKPRSLLGSEAGSKNTARPKSAASQCLVRHISNHLLIDR